MNHAKTQGYLVAHDGELKSPGSAPPTVFAKRKRAYKAISCHVELFGGLYKQYVLVDFYEFKVKTNSGRG